MSDHEVPFQRSAKARESARPTAQQLFLAVQTIPSSELTVVPAGSGVVMGDHALPFQWSTKRRTVPDRLVEPTAGAIVFEGPVLEFRPDRPDAAPPALPLDWLRILGEMEAHLRANPRRFENHYAHIDARTISFGRPSRTSRPSRTGRRGERGERGERGRARP